MPATIDTGIAERIRALGELAPRGYTSVSNLRGIRDGDPEKDRDGMVEALMKDHETVCATAREALATAGTPARMPRATPGGK